MSATTQILFNSPALHSLKRDQLVQLCKAHSIRASGKNVDLIARLKQHAQTLPKDSPLSIASRSEAIEDKENEVPSDMARPSQQWEVVMDTIPEDSETLGEFGSSSSKSSAFPDFL
jgi:hypothetical protein